MNSPPQDPIDGDDELRYGEYVLGVLDAEAHAAVTRELASSEAAAAAVASWQRRLTPLAESIAPVDPPARIWDRIQAATTGPMTAGLEPRSRAGLWNNLSLWHWVGIGATVAACALLVVVILLRAALRPGTASYLAATIQQTNGSTGWTAAMDLQHRRVVVVPATPVALPQGRAPELWVIPAGGKPIAVGMISRDRPTTLALPPGVSSELTTTAALAVSVEPPGGSPTGQPTGAVIGTGAIGAAAAGGTVT